MKKFVIYTGVFGKPCRSRIPSISSQDYDAICYTDIEIENDFYKVKPFHKSDLDPVRRNRFVKIMIPDELFDNYEYSLYIDYKHPLKVDFNWLMKCLGNKYDFLVSKHPKRNCIYEEGDVCLAKGKGDRIEILDQLELYRSKGYPKNNGLYANYWIFRRHTTQLKEIMAIWWKHVLNYSHRDQLSLPYILWENNYKISMYKRRK